MGSTGARTVFAGGGVSMFFGAEILAKNAKIQRDLAIPSM